MSDSWDPMNCSMPVFPIHQQLREPTQTHVYRVGNAIQLSQHQGLFKWVSSSYREAKYYSFSPSISPSNEYLDWFSLGLTGQISLQSKGLSRVFSSTTVQKQQFLSTQLSSQSNSNIHTSVQFSSVQSLSYVRLFATPWIAARQASLSITNSRSLLKLMSIESVMPSNHLILCYPLLLLP